MKHKSRTPKEIPKNKSVLNPKSAEGIIKVLNEKFGEDNLVSVALFGSMLRGTNKQQSDYDFTIILNNLPTNVLDREAISPSLKKVLWEKGTKELCSFNLYTKGEFVKADNEDYWLIETMKANFMIIYDKDNFLNRIFTKPRPNVSKLDNFAWSGVSYNDKEHITNVINEHKNIASILCNIDPEIAQFHLREAKKGELFLKLLANNIFDFKSSMFEQAIRLKYKCNLKLNIKSIENDTFLQETKDKSIMFDYKYQDRHIKVSKILIKEKYNLYALLHAFTALRNIYFFILHSNNKFIIDGEITQVFLREIGEKLPIELNTLIYENSYKAEHILSRSGYITFYIDKDGNPNHKDTEEGSINYLPLIENLWKIISKLESIKLELISEKTASPMISLVVSEPDNAKTFKKTLSEINNIVFPENQIEIILIKNSANSEDITELQKYSKFSIKIVSNDSNILEEIKGKYILKIEPTIMVTPLLLIQLMSGFISNDIVATMPKTISSPNYYKFKQVNNNYNLIRKDIFKQMKIEDNDIVESLRINGYKTKYISGAILFIHT